MIKAARGTQDILGNQTLIWRWIEDIAIDIFSSAAYQEIRTPIFESTELFSRSVGEGSDIVNKEMYSFLDKSERSLTLRPEGTAGIVRAFIENNLDRESKPQKFWYQGPMFRYERPQTGRYRQFHQIGVEAIGAKAPYIDLEVISLGVELLQRLGLKDLTLYINSIGNSNSRQNYIKELSQFIKKFEEQICDDCKNRLIKNPLRCLDCKVPADQELYKSAPNIKDFLDEESIKIFDETLKGLDELKIKYQVDHSLVRGLDYYSHCVFEIKTESKELGTQNTVLAGGRYDDLVSNLGGSANPAVGWALGEERLVQLIGSQAIQKESLFIISDSSLEASKLAIQLRKDFDGLVELDYENSKFKKQFEKALKKNFDWALFYLEDERTQNLFKVKKLKENKEFNSLSYQDLIKLLESNHAN